MEKSNDNKEIPELQCANVEKTKAELRHIRLSAPFDRTKRNLKYIGIDVEASQASQASMRRCDK